MKDVEIGSALRTIGELGSVSDRGPIADGNVIVVPGPTELNGVMRA